jgi:dihydrofolate reductase
MRNVIMWNLMTLDGCFEGKEPWDLSFHEDGWSEELAKLAIEQLAAADALLFGRTTYEGMARHWPTAKGTIAEGMNAIEKVVFTSTMQSADWNNTRLVRGDPAREVARLRAGEGGTLLIFGSAKLCASLIPAGLIDEYRVCIVPGLLGEGRPLFPTADPRAKTKLRLLDSWTTAKGCIVARYAPLTPTR